MKIFVLGPCAAESCDQVLETAESLNSQLSTLNFIYRAGIWKPRTSPSSFQGVGESGLPWLQEVQERYHLPVATEVATPDHVQAAMRAHIPYLWIGARTSANPIAVQAIADAISALPYEGKAGIESVLIKNPVNEDVNL